MATPQQSSTSAVEDAAAVAAVDDVCAGACTGFPDSMAPHEVPGVHHVLPGRSTHDFAESLPDLPVPPLEITLEQYLASAEPLASSKAAFAYTQEAVEEFLLADGRGRHLHEKLKTLAADKCGRDKPYPHTHWLEEMWDTLAYLSDRNPLSINVNCMGTLFECTSTSRPLWRAGAVMYGLMRFKRALDDETLAPECLDSKGRSPLCMWQYHRLFNHTRIPATKALDRWQCYPESCHVAVQVQNHWYTFDVVSPDGTLLSSVEFVKELEVIRAMSAADIAAAESDRKPRQPPIACMTSGKRDVWCENRNFIRKMNRKTAVETLEAIESAIFHVCLSKHEPATPVDMMNALCHGGESGKDLWMDKSFSMVVYANGKVGFNMEHSHADAPMHSRMVEFMKHVVHTECRDELIAWARRKLHRSISSHIDSNPMKSTVKRLVWCKDDEMSEASPKFWLRLENALSFAQDHISGHRLALMDFRDFGKSVLKKYRVSPDSFVQCALQLAFWRDQDGRVTATYETGTTRAFHHGRTECIRPLSSASRRMVELLDARSDATQHDRHAALMASFKAHGTYLRKACVGMGIDRHLLALRVLAMKDQSQPIPKLFTDPMFEKMNTYELSTSAMPVTHYKDFLGFGAPFPFSYGCCYSMTPDKCLMTITANASCKGKDVERFKGHVEGAMRDLIRVLQHGPGDQNISPTRTRTSASSSHKARL